MKLQETAHLQAYEGWQASLAHNVPDAHHAIQQGHFLLEPATQAQAGGFYFGNVQGVCRHTGERGVAPAQPPPRLTVQEVSRSVRMATRGCSCSNVTETCTKTAPASQGASQPATAQRCCGAAHLMATCGRLPGMPCRRQACRHLLLHC